ncbi:tripartite tricarboxylate transporter permease [Sinorhizobium meliloti]|uniref:DUF112 domain-containing protein n=1 Tax=Rhizobium meliloti TaxID=382 RepID=A0A2J0YTZ4_RHIML|nr:tripartite tricarboxylate transporter permease [Sinorhizobium meliloti]PJR09841.1 hypothetical protein CEJ86_30500 [Sinorhizobium meliloti]
MHFLDQLALGFSVVFTVQNLVYCFIGCFLGTLVGVLPGLGPVPTIAMLLPLTFGVEPVSALIMLAGLYYGSQYGGSTTAILINLPGESASIVTAIDGHQMARKGRAGTALATAAIGSFFAGTVATLLIACFAPLLAQFALQFGAPEYFSLMVLGLSASALMASGSFLKAIAMILLGILLGISGDDLYTGLPRLTFGIHDMGDGMEFVSIAMGVFGLSEIMKNLETEPERNVVVRTVKGLWLSRKDFAEIAAPVVRGTALGSILGVLPGGGALLASFASYFLEKRIAENPEKFGKGAIAGLAGPESANNAGAQTSFIPMLTLGIPSNAVMALMLAALIMQGITPGPNVINEQPQLFWGLIVSMWIGNLMLLVLNLPLIGIWVKLLMVPYRVLFPAIMTFGCIGVFTVNNNTFDVYAMAVFGIVGYILMKLDFEPAPLLLGFVLGPLLEENLIRSMLLSQGDARIFVQRPISATLLTLALLTIILVMIPALRKKRAVIFAE